MSFRSYPYIAFAIHSPYTAEMTRTLRKGNAHIHVTYRSGNFTNNLYAADFQLEVEKDSVTLSIDLSGNERTRSRDSHSLHDVREFREDFETIKFIQLDRADWLKPFAAAMSEDKTKARQLAFRFKDGKRLIMPIVIEAADFNITFANANQPGD